MTFEMRITSFDYFQLILNPLVAPEAALITTFHVQHIKYFFLLNIAVITIVIDHPMHICLNTTFV